MTEQDTLTVPAWLNLDALIDSETVAELHRLAEEVERIVADFEERLAIPCYRGLFAAETAAADIDMGDEGFELVRRWSGAGRLHDALYAFADTVVGANMERPNTEPAWRAKVRADLGVDEWGRAVDSGQEPVGG